MGRFWLISGMFLLLSFVLYSGCIKSSDVEITGRWERSTNVDGDGRPQVLFFKSNGTYYASNWNGMSEAGIYSTDNRELFTIDTLNEASTERFVEIVLLTDQELQLRVNAPGDDSILTFARQ